MQRTPSKVPVSVPAHLVIFFTVIGSRPVHAVSVGSWREASGHSMHGTVVGCVVDDFPVVRHLCLCLCSFLRPFVHPRVNFFVLFLLLCIARFLPFLEHTVDMHDFCQREVEPMGKECEMVNQCSSTVVQ